MNLGQLRQRQLDNDLGFVRRKTAGQVIERIVKHVEGAQYLQENRCIASLDCFGGCMSSGIKRRAESKYHRHEQYHCSGESASDSLFQRSHRCLS